MLQAYNQYMGGWDEILEFVKSQLASMSGNYLKKKKTVEYYNRGQKSSDKAHTENCTPKHEKSNPGKLNNQL